MHVLYNNWIRCSRSFDHQHACQTLTYFLNTKMFSRKRTYLLNASPNMFVEREHAPRTRQRGTAPIEHVHLNPRRCHSGARITHLAAAIFVSNMNNKCRYKVSNDKYNYMKARKIINLLRQRSARFHRNK